MTELEAAERANQDDGKKSSSKKRGVRPIPITSKIPLYDKLMAEKEERSVYDPRDARYLSLRGVDPLETRDIPRTVE